MGYERLRLAPGMAPSGMYWRYAIVPVSKMSRGHGARVGKSYHHGEYPFGSLFEGQETVGWGDHRLTTPRELAIIFLEKFSSVAESGRGSDAEYVRWYRDMLKRTALYGVIYAYSDY